MRVCTHVSHEYAQTKHEISACTHDTYHDIDNLKHLRVCSGDRTAGDGERICVSSSRTDALVSFLTSAFDEASGDFLYSILSSPSSSPEHTHTITTHNELSCTCAHLGWACALVRVHAHTCAYVLMQGMHNTTDTHTDIHMIHTFTRI